MCHRNSNGRTVSEHLWNVANLVHQLTLRKGVLECWRHQVTEWLKQPQRLAAERTPLDFELRMNEKYAVLGAIHDYAAGPDVKLIGPYDAPNVVTKEAVIWTVLRVFVSEYAANNGVLLQRFLADIQADLGGVFVANSEGPAHSPDFRSVTWFGEEYSFTANQAAIVGILWKNWESNTRAVSDSTLLEAAESNSERLDLVFRNHKAWGQMILPGQFKGTRRLGLMS